MKKLPAFLFFASLVFLYPNFSDAGVNFIVGPRTKPTPRAETTVHHSDKDITERSQECLQKGYTLRHCPTGSFAGGLCPENAGFFKKCCDASIYKYSSFSECTQLNKMPGGECGGKYSCED